MTSRLIQSLQMLLVPPRCVSCNLISSAPTQAGLCSSCFELCEPNSSARCTRCDLPLCTKTTNRCRQCMLTPPPFSQLRTPFLYGGPLAQSLLHFKFRNRVDLGPNLAKLIFADPAARLLLSQATRIIPVPLHKRRLRHRMHNQAGILARNVANLSQLPINYGLKRIRESAAQSSVPGPKRRLNLQGAFKATQSHLAESIVLIDDIVTSTHTARAAAQSLREAGAAEVHVLALARTIKTTDSSA